MKNLLKSVLVFMVAWIVIYLGGLFVTLDFAWMTYTFFNTQDHRMEFLAIALISIIPVVMISTFFWD